MTDAPWNLDRFRDFAEEALRAAPSPPSSIGPYRLNRELGRGAMGVVYEGEDAGLKRTVAVKILHDGLRENRSAYLRFQREAQSAAKLVHPNVIQVYGAGEDGERAYLVMERVAGRTLRDILADRAYELRPMLELVEKVARAVGAAHEAGIVHRDIKPANIIVTEAGEPKVGDFGLAHWMDSDLSLTRSGTPIGTPLYMSPEQVRGETGRISPATDVYALGAILYEVLTGRPPHRGDSTAEVYSKIVGDRLDSPRRLNPKVGRDLETLCLRALESAPQRRYPTGTAFAEDLRRHLAGEPILARPVSAPARLWRRVSKQRTILVSTAAALLLSASLAGWWITGRAARDAVAKRDADRAAAQKLLDTALPAIEKAGRLWYDPQADVAATLRRVEEVRPLIEQAVARAPDLTTGHHLLGRAWEALGWTSKAEACWREWIRLDPASGPAHFHLARLLALRGFAALTAQQPLEDAKAARFATEAAAELRSAIGSGSGFNDALQLDFVDAVLALARRDPVEARRICEKGISTYGRTEGAEDFHWLLGFVVSIPEKLKALNDAIDLCPNHPWARFGLGFYHEHEGALDKAIAEYDRAILSDSRFVDAYFNRGGCRYRVKAWRGAVTDYSRILEIEPGHQGALLHRGHARLAAGEYAGAIEDYSGILGVKPDSESAWHFRGFAKAQLGDPKGAIPDFGEAIRLAPAWDQPYLARGRTLARTGDLAGAVADLEQFLKTAPPGNPDRPGVEAQLKQLKAERQEH